MIAKKAWLAVVLCGTISACAATPPLVTPDPTATPNPTYTGFSVQFTSSISGGVPPLMYAWNFGDGGTDASVNPIHTFMVAGTFTVSLLVSDSAGQSHALNIQVSVIQSMPLAFMSPPTATPTPLGTCPSPNSGDDFSLRSAASSTAGPGEPIVFACAVNGNGALTFMWDFGDGSTDTAASPTHSYSSAGTYIATVSVTDATNQTISGSVNVVVNAPLIGNGLDSDGDGISDYIENVAGSCPTTPDSTPVANPAAPPTPLNITKMQIKLIFAQTVNRQKFLFPPDLLTISGTLPIPAGYDATTNQVVYIVGDLRRDPAPLGDNLALSSAGAPIIQIKKSHGVVSAQMAKFTIRLSDFNAPSFNFATALQPYGLINATTRAQVSVPVTVILNQVLFQTTVTLSYSATAGKSGMAKMMTARLSP